MTNSPEAISAAKELFPLNWAPAASIIQKHYAAKDAEIESAKLTNRSCHLEIGLQKDRAIHAEQERDQLKVRVGELEKALTKSCELNGYMCPCDFVSPKKGEEFVAAAYEIANLSLARSPSSALTRLQELERKAKALDWLEANRTNHIYSHFKFHSSNAATCKTWLEAIESAYEKK